jgi:hypothetical protein
MGQGFPYVVSSSSDQEISYFYKSQDSSPCSQNPKGLHSTKLLLNGKQQKGKGGGLRKQYTLKLGVLSI